MGPRRRTDVQQHRNAGSPTGREPSGDGVRGGVCARASRVHGAGGQGICSPTWGGTREAPCRNPAGHPPCTWQPHTAAGGHLSATRPAWPLSPCREASLSPSRGNDSGRPRCNRRWDDAGQECGAPHGMPCRTIALAPRAPDAAPTAGRGTPRARPAPLGRPAAARSAPLPPGSGCRPAASSPVAGMPRGSGLSRGMGRDDAALARGHVVHRGR